MKIIFILLVIILTFHYSNGYILPLSSLIKNSAKKESHKKYKKYSGGSMQHQSSFLSDASDDSREEEEADDIIGRPVGPLPTVSSRINFGDQTPKNIQHDLWVVGAGTLGNIICAQFKKQNPTANVIAETLTTSRHENFISIDCIPRLVSNRQLDGKDAKSARTVVIALTPSCDNDYAAAVSNATRLWAGPLGGGKLIFTSSLAVYGESNGNTVDEGFRLDTRSLRSTRLIAAEEAVISRDGIVVRLAGLYSTFRGPHTYWLKLGKEGKSVDGNADGLINLIHYEDAASLVCSIISSPSALGRHIFLGVDDESITRKEICLSALASKQFPDSSLPQFASETGPIGKKANPSWTRKQLQWSPSFTSFRHYMRVTLGGEVLVEPTKKEPKKSLLWMPGDDLEEFL